MTQNPSLWRMVPKLVAFRYTPKSYHRQMRDLIRAGAVTLNYLPCEKVDAPVRPGDIISIRGHGKAALTEAGGESRKGRIFLRGELYL